MIDLDSIADIGKGVVAPAIYTDPDLYQLELANVFGRSWLFLAHDSQLPKPGSFVQTYMAEDPVLVVRQRDGSVKAFLNQCRHRGMRICRAEAGTNKTFTCSYHGWAYDLEGNLINVPGEQDAYHGQIDKARWSTQKVPRIANYRGFYFGCWSEDTPEFTDYLGDMAWYFDAYIDRWPGGLEFVPGTTKWVIDCNWKLAAEQFASDMYHGPISHASATIALIDPSAEGPGHDNPAARIASSYEGPGRQFAGNGHGSGSFWLPFPSHNMIFDSAGTAFYQWQEENKDEIIRRIGDVRPGKVNTHNTIFPNFSWLGLAAAMRVWHPRGPGSMEVWSWTYVPKDAPDKVKDEVRQGTQRTFSPAGVFESDDGENWTEVQQVLRGWKARSAPFNVTMGRGYAQRDVHGLPGTTNHVYAETASRGFLQRWSDLVRGLSWEQAAELDKRREKEEVQPA